MSALVHDSILDCIGSTPLLALSKLSPKNGATIYAKLEGKNPGGSCKDRVALAMIRDAEARGKLRPGSTIIEPTSGNTGIGLALTAAALGYRAILIMPANARAIRRDTLRQMGAEVVETNPADGMLGAVEKAREIAKKTPDVFLPNQFQNPSNPGIHQKTTSTEIIESLDGKAPHAFIAGIGTGGTITGIGRAFKKKYKDCKVIAVEPLRAYNLPGAGGHCIEGIGVGFVPTILDFRVIDEFIQVSEEEALSCQRQLAQQAGILIGPSSGAAFYGAKKVARKLPKQAKVVVLFPDTGERYFDTREQK